MIKTKEKKVKKYFILTAICLMILFLTGCNILTITKSNYDKIYEGMSRAEVIEILGDDYEVSSEAGYGGYSASCYVWEGIGGSAISIMFMNEKVISKAQTGLW